MKVDLTEKEIGSLIEFIERHNEPCKDCDKDKDCGVANRGICIAINVDKVSQKLRILVN